MDWEYIGKRKLVRAKQLVKDYLAWKHKDHSKKPTCKQEDFLSWDCCRYHRQLNDRQGALQHRAETLAAGSFSSEGDTFSAKWWQDFQAEFKIDVPAELTS